MVLYLLRPGEYVLKGEWIRKRNEERLIHNIRDLAKKFDVKILKIEKEPGRIFVETNRETDIFRYLIGIKSYSEVKEYEFKDFEDLIQKIVEYFKDKVKGKSFALRVRRIGKHDFKSIDVVRKAGEELLKFAKKVDLENPEVECWVEIRRNKVYLFEKIEEGQGGLPVGTEGRVLSLISSGFDSIISSYYALRRGCEADFLHFYITEEGYKNVLDLLKEFKRRFCQGYNPKLYLIPYQEFLKEARKEERHTCVLCKRFMLKISEKIALEKGYKAIVTGDVLGQVATQTLENIFSISYKIKVPIFRPLISFDKDEIVKKIKDLGLYEFGKKGSTISCPFKPENPITKVSVQRMIELEEKYGSWIKRLLGKVQIIEV